MGYKYAKTGPPFHFLGHFSESQKEAFKKWIDARAQNFPAIQEHNQIRAQQLRKLAGILEKHYQDGEQLGPSFQKEAWQPGPEGHTHYAFRDDHQPMVVMSQIKDKFQDQLQRQDEAVFHMNQVRVLIERHEDTAQVAKEAPTEVQQLWAQIETLFTQPQYQAVLVKDKTDTYGKDAAGNPAPRFRVHQLDEPTPWERDLINRNVV